MVVPTGFESVFKPSKGLIMPTVASTSDDGYNAQVAYVIHRQHTGEEVHDARCATALNSGF